MLDAADKATGHARFTDDFAYPGMLYGKILRSPLPHAKILNIDISRALRLPGVKAVITAKESEGKVHLDPASLNPTFDYADDDDKRHHVWFMDAVTVFNQMVVARPLQPRGFALWRMGSEDPSLWT